MNSSIELIGFTALANIAVLLLVGSVAFIFKTWLAQRLRSSIKPG